MIRLENLNKHYMSKQGQVQALTDINLDVKAGEVYGIIGRSGAGKSTLIRCVNLLERPSSGKVSVNGVDMLSLSEETLRQKRHSIGMIFQHFNLLVSRNVFDNIALPLELLGTPRQKIVHKVDSLLELTGLTARKNYFPAELSGGQKQRVAIARALACDPQVLLSDESTSSLDPETTLSILNLLQTINKELNLTILLITHEMQVIKQICDRAGILDQGRLVEEAPVIELFTKPKSDIAKGFIQSALHLELPDSLKAQLQKSPGPDLVPIVRMAFIGDQTSEPLIATLTRRYSVIASILQANMDMVHRSTIGIAVCEMLGEPEAVKQSLQFLADQGVTVEVLGYVPAHVSTPA